MANLAIVGTHSTNGVAAIHSELAPHRPCPTSPSMFPERFNNKTNGVTPRRWLLLANPAWRSCSPRRSATAGSPTSAGSRASLRWPTTRRSASGSAAKRAAKVASWTGSKATGAGRRPRHALRLQIKRIHEYKRQLLNVLHIVVLYNRLRANPDLDVPPRTFLFAGKAAPGVPPRQADHQADQQRRRRDQRRPGRARQAARSSSCRTIVHARRAADPGQRRLRADLDRRLRGQRHEQHEVHDERRPDGRHPRRRRPSRSPRRPARRTSSCSA